MSAIQNHAWQGRTDLVDLDWREICERYPLDDVLGEGPNVSHKSRRISLLDLIGGGIIIVGLIMAFTL